MGSTYKIKMCMCFTRKFRMSEAEAPPDVKEAFFRFSDGKNLMSAEQLFKFLVEFQGESAEATTIEDAERIIVMILQRRHHIAKFTRNALNLDDFHHFLFSEDLNPPIITQVSHDMTAPLSHYFIFTGHNSYLTGNQLSSDCSDKPIIKALQRGVRVIELDLWPNSSRNDVHVLHGRTLTAPVELIKCLRSIKEYAFVASEYPLVITLEDHLTPSLQAKVAEMVAETFGDQLFYPESECIEEFPSPESLKFRILLSTKPPKEYLEAKSFKEKAKDSSEDETWGQEVMDINVELEADDSDRSFEQNRDCEDVNDRDGKSGLLGAPKEADEYDSLSGLLGAPKYKRLIAIQAKKNKGGLKESLKVDPTRVSRLSLSEQEFEKGTISRGTDLVRFTQRNFLRIYPKGTRFNSSNYNPLIGWLHGAQMVAFNMQGYGRYLWLMQGLFRSNGGCGYVKKPDLLMKLDSDNRVFNPKANLTVKKTLKVKVYMGDGWRFEFKETYFDAYSPPDFYVRVGIAGVPADLRMKRTKILEDDWTPVWDEEFCFPLTVPELALLRIEVHEYDMSEKDDFGGQTCYLVSELKSGIRTVPLYDRKGEKFKFVKLLMRFAFV